MSKKKIVIVEWTDAWGSTEDIAADTAHYAKGIICYDVGFLLADTKEGVTIATCSDEQEQFRFPHFFPRGMVRKVTELKQCRSKAASKRRS